MENLSTNVCYCRVHGTVVTGDLAAAPTTSAAAVAGAVRANCVNYVNSPSRQPMLLQAGPDPAAARLLHHPTPPPPLIINHPASHIITVPTEQPETSTTPRIVKPSKKKRTLAKKCTEGGAVKPGAITSEQAGRKNMT